MDHDHNVPLSVKEAARRPFTTCEAHAHERLGISVLPQGAGVPSAVTSPLAITAWFFGGRPPAVDPALGGEARGGLSR